jgi:dipeptidyl aminopeptidase/acylaminoacyl peptidase
MPTLIGITPRPLILLMAIGLVAILPACSLPSPGTLPAETPSGTAKPGTSAPTIEQFLKIRVPTDPTLAPDGSLYLQDWPDGIFQLYVRKAGADPQAPLTRLTDFPDGLGGYSLSPDGTKIVLSHAPGGNEQYQLSLLDPATSTITQLLDDPNAVHSLNLWLRDGSGFIYTANAESPADFYIYRYDFATGKSEKLLSRPGSWSASDITEDGSRLLVVQSISISEARPYELSLASGELRSLAMDDTMPHADIPIGYLSGEQEILMASDIEDGISRLFVKQLATGSTRKPLPALDPHIVDSVVINYDRTLMGVATNREGFSDMHVVELPTFRPISAPTIEAGVLGAFELRENTLVWTLSNAQTPSLAYAWSVGDSDPPRQLTVADTQGIDLSSFPLPKLIKYRSFDGLEVPAFLFTPPGYQKGRPIPFIVSYHGGPEAQSRPTFSRETQYLLAQGYGVLMPNVRGSTGYGRAYHELDNYKKRWDSVRDGVEAARWLVADGYAEPGKIAAYGGSYGGFMAVAAAVEDGASPNPVLGAVVDVVGIVNMRTFLEQTRDYRRELREAEYGPLSDPEFLDSISPLNRVDQIRVPVMIAHGLNDPRVPIGEAMQLAEGLMRRGLDPEQVYFHDEGHGFAKLDNRLLFAKRMVAFLDKHLRG